MDLPEFSNTNVQHDSLPQESNQESSTSEVKQKNTFELVGNIFSNLNRQQKITLSGILMLVFGLPLIVAGLYGTKLINQKAAEPITPSNPTPTAYLDTPTPAPWSGLTIQQDFNIPGKVSSIGWGYSGSTANIGTYVGNGQLVAYTSQGQDSNGSGRFITIYPQFNLQNPRITGDFGVEVEFGPVEVLQNSMGSEELNFENAIVVKRIKNNPIYDRLEVWTRKSINSGTVDTLVQVKEFSNPTGAVKVTLNRTSSGIEVLYEVVGDNTGPVSLINVTDGIGIFDDGSLPRLVVRNYQTTYENVTGYFDNYKVHFYLASTPLPTSKETSTPTPSPVETPSSGGGTPVASHIPTPTPTLTPTPQPITIQVLKNTSFDQNSNNNRNQFPDLWTLDSGSLAKSEGLDCKNHADGKCSLYLGSIFTTKIFAPKSISQTAAFSLPGYGRESTLTYTAKSKTAWGFTPAMVRVEYFNNNQLIGTMDTPIRQGTHDFEVYTNKSTNNDFTSVKVSILDNDLIGKVWFDTINLNVDVYPIIRNPKPTPTPTPFPVKTSTPAPKPTSTLTPTP
ncbi:hypothetical protein KW795_00860 [Candidatus Microgenomates bacterium]|nr:hypothetical protein [Candidatus Microgenomates bacterium]